MLKTNCIILMLCMSAVLWAQEQVAQFEVYELSFAGPFYAATDNPVRDVKLQTRWQHGSGTTLTVWGFFDGDGSGNPEGNVFRVRFCPILPGTWTLVSTASNVAELQHQHEGFTIECAASQFPGFWLADKESAGGRWYKRSDGSFPYIVGNTMYSFLSEMNQDGPNGSNIAKDIQGNADYFNKVRFSLFGDRYPNPNSKPFLDESGKPTDDGNYSHRPNAEWFANRVDVAVREAFQLDLVADLILCGPDTKESRATLKAAANNGDAEPWLRYIAARYGSYPNVWICLANEWNIKRPKYSAEEIRRFGQQIDLYLPYSTPVSVHAAPKDWNPKLNTHPDWNDHVILQYKIKALDIAADFMEKNYWIGGPDKPVIDDELAYEGAGDGYSEADVIEAHLGAFIGGGYGSTGFKHPKSKQGHYFGGDFSAQEHTSADNLQWMRAVIDSNITFWRMRPRLQPDFGRSINLGPFRNVHLDFRSLEWQGHEYILATNRAWENIQVRLPEGSWRVVQYNLIDKTKTVLAERLQDKFAFDAPDSRAVLFFVEKMN